MKKYNMNKILLLFVFYAILISGTGMAQQTSDLVSLIIEFQADRRLIQRFYTVPGANETIQRKKQLSSTYLNRLSKMDFGPLSVDQRVDYLLFERSLLEFLREQEKLSEAISNARHLFPFEQELYQIITSKRRGQQPEAQKLAEQMTIINRRIERNRQAINAGAPLDAQFARPAINHLKKLALALEETHQFYFAYDPQYTWWVAQPYTDLDKRLKDYVSFLDEKKVVKSNQKEDDSGIVGTPIGEDEVLKQLEHALIPYSPKELIQIAEQEFAWCDREMLLASTEMGFGDAWKKALEAVKTTYVEPGQQPGVINRLYDESAAFLKKNDLITIPPLAEETWRMSMMSPERQRINPFFLGGERIIISYPTSEMTHEEKLMSMRGNNPHFSRATVHHELIPGHGLQFFMNDRNNTHRMYWTPFWTEGWALYWERLLWDLGFPEGPEDKIGMLFWRMHRCARIIFSLKYHLGEWTPQECIDFLVDRVGHERANAEGEVRRSFKGGYSPLYQLAYMIGGLQFEALKKELVDSGQMSYRTFHDAVLKENNMPVEMLRFLLKDQEPDRDFKTSWRFYDL
jgi:hypothetical protein